MNVLLEGVGQSAWGPLFPYVRAAATKVIGTAADPESFGLYFADRGYVVPAPDDARYYSRMLGICRRERVDVVIPAIDSALVSWAEHAGEFAKHNIDVLLSPKRAVRICQDKWRTYEFFRARGIPTPRTSLRHEYELIKPRQGEGGMGIFRASPSEGVSMEGRISQELIYGEELSIDALCDTRGRPAYIVPRLRVQVDRGQSVIGRVVRDDAVRRYVRRILAAMRFRGPVNIQCFRTAQGIRFTEINPRISGGLSLSMAATENWFDVIARWRIGERRTPKRVRYGQMMLRHLAECIVNERDVIHAIANS